MDFNSLLTGGGTDDRAVNAAYGLQRRGHRVCVAGPEGAPCAAHVRERELPFAPLPSTGVKRLAQLIALVRVVRHERAHILQVHHGRDYWVSVLAARLSGVRPRLVLCRHLAKSPQSWMSRRFLLGRCDAVVAVSEFVAQVLRHGAYEPDSPEPERRRRPPMCGDLSKIHVIYGGFEIERFEPRETVPLRREWGLTPDHYVFGVVGGYPPPRGKGQREFLQAAARIREQAPHARFLLIGRGGLGPILDADIARLGLDGIAWRTAYCTDMPQAMNLLDCLVHPNMGTEALPGVMIEAQACGKPVIATQVDGNTEAFSVTGCGRLIRPEAIDELAAAMLAQVRQPPRSMSERWDMHRRILERFSVDDAARNYEALYATLLAAPAGRRPASGARAAGHRSPALSARPAATPGSPRVPPYYHGLAPFRKLFASGLPILTYHKLGPRPPGVRLKGLYVSAALFARQLSELRRAGFETVSLDYLHSRGAPEARRVVLTFDDGFASVIQYGLEPLAAHGCRAIVFLVAGGLGRASQWQEASGERLEPLMDVAQVRDWLAAGHEIGAHTLSHPWLTRLSLAQAREEIGGGKKQLEDTFGVPVRHFCYPYGDWNAPVRDLVAESGFQTACTVGFGVNTAATPRLELRRITARYRSRNPRAWAAWLTGRERRRVAEAAGS